MSRTMVRTAFISAARSCPNRKRRQSGQSPSLRSSLPSGVPAMAQNNLSVSLVLLFIAQAAAQAPQPKSSADYGPSEWVDSDHAEPAGMKFNTFKSQTIQ